MTTQPSASDTRWSAQSRWPTLLTLFGAISGVVSAIAILPFAASNDARLLVIFVVPGLAFGIIMSIALCRAGWLRPARVPVWILSATLGHFAAALCVTALTWRLQAALPLNEQSAILAAAALGGALGGGTLAAATRLLIPGAAWMGPTIVGAVLGPLVLLHDLGPILGRLVFYVIWQAGYAVALAFALPSRASPRPIGDEAIEPANAALPIRQRLPGEIPRHIP